MTFSRKPGALLDRDKLQSRNVERLALGIILLLHLAATCRFLPPAQVLRSEPLQVADHPLHTHRVYMYREGLRESGLPWGYDPEISAGAVMNPGQDLGAKPQEVLGVLLPFLDPGAVVRLFLFFVVLTAPLWVLLACRQMGIPLPYQAWILFMLIASTWLLQEGAGYWHVGLNSFAATAFFSVYVLTLFLNFLSKPTGRKYLAVCFAGAVLFLLHILGPVVILPSLLLYTFSARSISWSWRLALLLAPVVVLALNAFWVIPFMAAQHIPWPSDVIPSYPPDAIAHLRFHSWSQLGDLFSNMQRTGPLLLRILLACYGFFVLKEMIGRRAAVSFGLACGFAFFLAYFGSFIQFFVRMQPVRFEVHLLALLAIPAGAALAALTAKCRLPVSATAAVLAMILALGVTIFRPRPYPLELPSPSDPLTEFITTHTAPQDRLFIQSRDGYRGGWYETKIFPLLLNREVVGSNYQIVYDPPQFLKTMLLGRKIQDWEPAALHQALIRWGATWVFTVTPDAQALMEATLGPMGEMAGDYCVFRVPEAPTRFMAGSGQIESRVNRIELSRLQPEEGLVVLRYRFNPGWYAEPDIPIHQFAVPEDSMGFIALKDPPASVTLHFDPWAMLSAHWPDPGSPLRLR